MEGRRGVFVELRGVGGVFSKETFLFLFLLERPFVAARILFE